VRNGLARKPAEVAVTKRWRSNVSAVEFRSDRFFEGVRRIWRTTGLDPSYLTLELTETADMRDLEATRVVLQALSTMGMRIAVGDFGTGDSNLSDLKRFPINTMKVDRSFIHDRSNNADCSTTLGSSSAPLTDCTCGLLQKGWKHCNN
jgi:EAL domain-containing protein (putative c-di-GMP-specific phosphodiesterase class I)